MVAEAQTSYPHDEVQVQSALAAYGSGEVVLLLDGRAGIVAGLNARAIGDAVTFITAGVFNITKSTSVQFLPGQEVWWDATNNEATYSVAGDFKVGIAVADATAAATTVAVALNGSTHYHIEQGVTGFDYATTLTAGVPSVVDQGGSIRLAMDTTAEAQRAEALSKDSIAITANPIVECILEVTDNGDDAALDINVGLADAGHASNADTIAESVFFHIDGNVLNILAESDDGTVEVVATDTTKDYVVGTAFFVQIDARDPADIQLLINGVNVLGATVFRLDAGTGPMKLIAHIEKSSNDTPGAIEVTKFRAYKAA